MLVMTSRPFQRTWRGKPTLTEFNLIQIGSRIDMDKCKTLYRITPRTSGSLWFTGMPLPSLRPDPGKDPQQFTNQDSDYDLSEIFRIWVNGFDVYGLRQFRSADRRREERVQHGLRQGEQWQTHS